jgi:hypothetical protein
MIKPRRRRILKAFGSFASVEPFVKLEENKIARHMSMQAITPMMIEAEKIKFKQLS